jgi:hypothetical protein
MYYSSVLLEKMYLKPITYEDPILLWKGDTAPIQNAIGQTLRIPKKSNFIFPVEADPEVTKNLDIGLLERVNHAYQTQTNGPIFKIIKSDYGFHIIPDEVRDQTGRYVKVKTVLDIDISIPFQKRTPQGHINAICNAISSKNSLGVEFKCYYDYINGYYADISISRNPTEEELDKISFVWGSKQMNARNVLINLFKKSSSTLKWVLSCTADDPQICVLNITPLTVKYIRPDGSTYDSALSDDRKKNDP